MPWQGSLGSLSWENVPHHRTHRARAGQVTEGNRDWAHSVCWKARSHPQTFAPVVPSALPLLTSKCLLRCHLLCFKFKLQFDTNPALFPSPPCCLSFLHGTILTCLFCLFLIDAKMLNRPPTSTSHPRLHPHWPPPCPFITPGALLPQGLCTGRCLCNALPPHIHPACSLTSFRPLQNVTFSKRPTLTTHLKQPLVHIPAPSPDLSFLLIHTTLCHLCKAYRFVIFLLHYGTSLLLLL